MDYWICGGVEIEGKMLSKIIQIIKGSLGITLNEPQKFENYICRYFKDSGEFDLIKRPGLLIEGIKSEQDNLPDCKFRDKRSNKKFWVECKWRPEWRYSPNEEKILYFKNSLIELYKRIQKKSMLRIFFALGIGIYKENKTDIKPSELYFFPLDMFANRDYIRQSYLIKTKRMHMFKFKKPKFFPDTNDLK